MTDARLHGIEVRPHHGVSPELEPAGGDQLSAVFGLLAERMADPHEDLVEDEIENISSPHAVIAIGLLMAGSGSELASSGHPEVPSAGHRDPAIGFHIVTSANPKHSSVHHRKEPLARSDPRQRSCHPR